MRRFLPAAALFLAASASIATSEIPVTAAPGTVEEEVLELGSFETDGDDKARRIHAVLQVANPTAMTALRATVEFSGVWDGEGEPPPFVVKVDADGDEFGADEPMAAPEAEHSVEFTASGVRRTEDIGPFPLRCPDEDTTFCQLDLVLEFDQSEPGMTTFSVDVLFEADIEEGSPILANLSAERITSPQEDR